jgi:hypothetical protein
MIGPAQFVNGIWMGIVLIALGLIPGILENLTDLLRKITGMSSLAPIPSRWQAQGEPVQFKQQPWLAILGGIIIAATVILFSIN